MLVVMVVIGIIAGFVVHGWMHRGGGLSLDANLIVGLLGSSLGVIAPRIIKNMLDIGIGGGLLGLLIWSTLCAVILLVIANLIKRATIVRED